ncbi:hypothetical protein C8R46DRAFT_1186188 [Mycena filopes]|nr:hypothetical protein C8R46DRAFT_1186188 [Mycena filopes]
MATALVPDMQAPTAALDTLQQFLQTSSTEITRLRRELKRTQHARDEWQERYLGCRTQLSAVEKALGDENLARVDAEEALRTEREEREGRIREEEQALRDERAQLAAKVRAFGESLEQPVRHQSGKRPEREWESGKAFFAAMSASEDHPRLPKRAKIQTPHPAASSSSRKVLPFDPAKLDDALEDRSPGASERDAQQLVIHSQKLLEYVCARDFSPSRAVNLAPLGSPTRAPLGPPPLSPKFPDFSSSVYATDASLAVKTPTKTPSKSHAESLPQPAPDLSPLRPLDLSPCEFPDSLAPVTRRRNPSRRSTSSTTARSLFSSSGSLSFRPT